MQNRLAEEFRDVFNHGYGMISFYRQENGKATYEDDIKMYTWPQMWGGGDVGYGGMSACAMTYGQVSVIQHKERGPAVVCVAGRYAYVVKTPNKTFYDAMHRFSLMGAADYKKRADEYNG